MAPQIFENMTFFSFALHFLPCYDMIFDMNSYRIFTLGAAVLCAAGLSFTASAETWTWTGLGTWLYNNTAKDWRDGANWVDSKGVAGTQYPDNTYRPGNGDIIIFDGAVKSEQTHCFEPSSGAYGGVIYTNSFGGSYGPQVPIQDGGFVRYATSKDVGNQSYGCSGTFEFFVAGSLFVNSHFNNGTGTIRKTGAGELRLHVGTASFRTKVIELEEGILGVSVVDALTSLSQRLVFDGDNVTLDLKDKSQKMSAALEETPGISGHKITASANACLTLTGNQSDATFSGKVTGKASLCWNPNAEATLTLTGTIDTTGTLTVSNGVLDVAASTVSPAVCFAVGGSGRLALPSGIYNGRLLVNGEAVPAGAYTGTGTRGVAVDWLEGDGLIIIGADVGTEALWTGTGSVGVAANWNGATETPALYDGSTILKTTTPVSGAVADIDKVFLYGLALGGGADFTLSGTKGFWLGAGGMVLSGAAKMVMVETPIAAISPQLWDLSNGGQLHLKVPITAAAPDAKVTMTNGTVTIYGGTQEVALAYSKSFAFGGGSETVFKRKVQMMQTIAGTLNSGSSATRIIYDNGLELCNAASAGASDITMSGQGTTIFTNGILNVYSSKRINFTSGIFHFYSPNNSFNDGQRGYIHGNAVLYFHVTNAFTSTQANLAGNHGDGGIIDLCGCDQTIGSIQCGRGLTDASGTQRGWKWATHPGTIRSEQPAILHITGGGWSMNPGTSSSPTTTNFAYFVGMAGISYEGGSTGHWLNQTCSSTGTVQTTKGSLHFSKRVIDGDGCDLGEGSWPNAARVVAKGTGTLVLEHSKAIGKKTDVIIEENGKVQLDAGVDQKCANLYFGNEKQALGTWGSPESAATYRDARFTGTGILTVRGERPGVLLIFR